MKVLYICDWNTEGGAARSLINTLEGLISRDIEPIVCTGSRSFLHDELDRMNISYIISKHPYAMYSATNDKHKVGFVRRNVMYHLRRILSLLKINSCVDFDSIDIIHTNSARSDIGLYLSKQHNIPHVVHLREFGKEDYNCDCVHKDYAKLLNEYADYFISVSKAVKSRWVREGLDANKVDVIYNGVSDTQYEHACREDDNIKFVICGVLHEAKGQLDAVRAIKSLKEKGYNNIQLYIYGWGENSYSDNLKLFVEDNNLSDCVFFKKAVKDIYKELAYMDVGLTCSKSEGFGRVTAEYMYSELPVIASDTGANPELVNNKVTGLLYHNGDIDSLVGCMERYINDSVYLKTCGKQARKYALEHFSVQENVDRIYEVYKKL